MGVFSDNVRRLYEYGIITIPCKNKMPVLGKDWQTYCNDKPTEDLIDKWEEYYKDVDQLGLTLGSATFLSAFDFDYEYDAKKSTVSKAEFTKDQKSIERQILAILPLTPCIKTGKKGWTRIYRSHGNLENAQADRNGVRLFDFLARNKQTIIPPSKYPDEDNENLVYKWANEPLEDCLNDIPYITQDMVDEIKFLLGENVDDNSRHMRLLKWIIRQSVLDKDLDSIVRKAIDHDQIINNPPYLTDKKHHSKTDAYSNAEYWIKRIIKWKDSKTGSKAPEQFKKIKASQEMFFQFFEKELGLHKREMLSDNLLQYTETKTQYGSSINRWTNAYNSIPSLRAKAMDIELEKTCVEDYLNLYHKSLTPTLLLDIPEWDGLDRIDKICWIVPATNIVPTLTNQDEMGRTQQEGHDLYVEIVKDIAAGIFRRAFDSMEQNLFTILRGGQGIGKNTFIDHLYIRPFGHYAAEINLGQDVGKNYDAVDGKLVCVIGEFDQAQKIQISFMKELITNASITTRKAYERRAEKYSLHQTFFSASNFPNVLKDTSGNRRFVIFDMDHIDYSYVQWCDHKQLLAQYYALYKEGFRMGDKAKAWIKEFNEKETPDDPMELAVEEYIDQMKNKKREQFILKEEWLPNKYVTELINEVCKLHGVLAVRLRQTLGRKNLSKRSNGTKYLNLTKMDKWTAEKF